MSENVIMIGGGGHAKVLIDCIECIGDKVVGILDDALMPGTKILNVPVLGKVNAWQEYPECKYIIAIGNNAARQRIAESIAADWYTVIHPTAVVSKYASVGKGSVVLPRSVINAGAVIGNHCIINTAAIVEHDNRIGDYVHISPNAALAGTVTVGECTQIGIGASVKNNINICENCVIGAGAAVVKDITESGTYIGVPARRMK